MIKKSIATMTLLRFGVERSALGPARLLSRSARETKSVEKLNARVRVVSLEDTFLFFPLRDLSLVSRRSRLRLQFGISCFASFDSSRRCSNRPFRRRIIVQRTLALSKLRRAASSILRANGRCYRYRESASSRTVRLYFVSTT